jgi:hypothetical protein
VQISPAQRSTLMDTARPTLTIRYSNVAEPPTPEDCGPCVIIEDNAVTIWDWSWEPDDLSIALVVTALEALGCDLSGIAADATYHDLLLMLTAAGKSQLVL